MPEITQLAGFEHRLRYVEQLITAARQGAELANLLGSGSVAELVPDALRLVLRPLELARDELSRAAGPIYQAVHRG